MQQQLSRRRFASVCGASACALAARASAQEQTVAEANSASKLATSDPQPMILKSLKWGMIQGELSTLDKFKLVQELGFDGVELDSPGGVDKGEAKAASIATGLPIDGTVDSTHWSVRLTDPSADVREQSWQDLLTAIRETHFVGGHSVLLVPGHGKDGGQRELFERSQVIIRRALPMASRLGIYILIENVWNEMFYDKQGGDNQTADELAQFVDELNSPWVGVQFDIGNHQKYGKPAEWIRTLGKRIVKLDVKDWGREGGFCKIGDGDVDWNAVRVALHDIGYTGWAAAEVSGGGRERLADVARRMDAALGIC